MHRLASQANSDTKQVRIRSLHMIAGMNAERFMQQMQSGQRIGVGGVLMSAPSYECRRKTQFRNFGFAQACRQFAKVGIAEQPYIVGSDIKHALEK